MRQRTQQREEMRQERQTMMEAFDMRLESLLLLQNILTVVQPELSPYDR